ncbi:MAG TPA: PEP/pyruvate-binding domain-containing protein, partial [Cyclobacteriaceae bacterium]
MVISLRELDRTKIALAGGKGANLGELFTIHGINVPDGFCITTDVKELTPGIKAQITSLIEEGIPYAVRSSATAEDLPTASFAGQHDTYLNIVGAKEILIHVEKCRASLFTDRAKAYRAQNNFDDRSVRIAVVVQKMVASEISGIMFTADPLTSNRKLISIEATAGLGENLVSGLVNSDGGLLTDRQRKELEEIGRKVETHFGSPQDIEWCLADGKFYIVQSRPITTLYPIPERTDKENHVYLSVGHQQMMTDAMKPLGLTMWQAMSPAPMFKAGGRLFVDVTLQLSSLAGRTGLLNTMAQHDPLIKGALETLIEREFIKLVPVKDGQPPPRNFSDVPPVENDPSVVDSLIKRWETSLEELKENIQSKSGVELIDFIRDDIPQFRKALSDTQSMSAIMAAINASV